MNISDSMVEEENEGCGGGAIENRSLQEISNCVNIAPCIDLAAKPGLVANEQTN